jgi:hypothetical protein
MPLRIKQRAGSGTLFPAGFSVPWAMRKGTLAAASRAGGDLSGLAADADPLQDGTASPVQIRELTRRVSSGAVMVPVVSRTQLMARMPVGGLDD